MFRLLKNEFYKIFHKKSTIVLLIVLSMLMILMTIANYYYFSTDSYNGFGTVIYGDDISNNLNESDPNYKYNLVNSSANTDTRNLYSQYMGKWQSEIISNDYYSKLYEYYYALYVEEDNVLADNLKKEIDQYVTYFETDNWQEVVKLQIKSMEEEIDSLKEQHGDSISGYDKTEVELLEYKIGLYNYQLEEDIYPSFDNYLYEALRELMEDKNYVIDYDNETMSKDQYDSYMKNILSNEYMLDNKEDVDNEHSLYALIKSFVDMNALFIIIFVIFISSNIISKEYSKGTIKTLLISPYSRTQIILSKLLTSLSMILVIIFILFVIQFILGGILYGYDTLSIPVISFSSDLELIKSNVFIFMLNEILVYSPIFILITMISFTLTSLVASASLGIVISMLAYISYPIINLFIFEYEILWLNYFISVNWEYFKMVKDYGEFPIDGVTFVFALVMCIIYFVVFTLISIIAFNKKDVKNQ